jgi:release factor glutamine methyltransferase
MRSSITTISDTLKEAQILLKKSNISTYKLDAKILLSHILKLNNSEELLFKLNQKISELDYFQYFKLINRRSQNEPIAYIIGNKDFWKQNYTIDHNVLIPRPETELIIELLLKKLSKKINANLNILELGTGSGCIILSLLSELKYSNATAIDLSKKALNIAKLNAQKFSLDNRVNFKLSNWFSNLTSNFKFDIIIANPPYISLNDWETLDKNVKYFEPKEALTDNKDGLKNYRIIAKYSKNYLSKDGVIALEIGINQNFAIQNIFQSYEYQIDFYKDLQSIERVAIITKD